jgi:hypothetical protein
MVTVGFYILFENIKATEKTLTFGQFQKDSKANYLNFLGKQGRAAQARS